MDAAFAAALPTADPHRRQLIAEAILERAQPQALATLAANIHQFQPHERQGFASRILQSSAAMRLVLDLPGRKPALNIIDLIQNQDAVESAYLIAILLRRSDWAVRTAAARCLLFLCRNSVSRSCPSGKVALLDSALTDAVQSYSRHRRGEILLAAVSTLKQLPRARETLFADSQALAALRNLLARSPLPAVRRSLVQCLTFPPLRHAAALGILRAFVQQAWRDLASQTDLLATLSLADLGPVLGNAAKHLPGKSALAKLSPDVQQSLVRWVAHMPLPDVEKASFLAQYADLTPVPARLAALKVLIDLPQEAVSDALWSFAVDAEEQISVCAVRALLSRKSPQLPTRLPELLSSPHSETRDLAQAALSCLAWENLWLVWPRLRPPQRVQIARSAAKAGVDVVSELRERLAIPNQTQNLRAIVLCRQLDLSRSLEPTLRRAALASDAVVASAAVMALAGCSSFETLAVLERCLDHADPRVRSNAIEALQQQGQSRRHRLRQLARDEANRPRATAIATLLASDAPMAQAALSQMLQDPRPRHRTSALWVVESRAVLPFAASVAEMAVTDPDPQVRNRAARVARGLMQGMVLSTPLPAQAA